MRVNDDDHLKRPVIVVGTGAGNMRMLTGSHDPAPITDPIDDIAPALAGPHGRAWQTDREAGRAMFDVPAERDATIAHWVVEAPWAHPAWHSYCLVLVHLRPLRGIDTKTKFYLRDATHELWVYALDPQRPRRPLITTGMPDRHYMQPKNFAAQFIEVSDELATARVARTVQQICDGQLSPDTDAMRDWIALYGDNMVKRGYR